MYLTRFLPVFVICLMAGLFLSGPSLGSSLDKVQFIKIAPQDAKAVIKGADGKLRIIKPGDVIEGTTKVVGVASGRIVLEEKTDKGMETVIVRIENGRQRIERVRKQAEVRPVPVAPQTSTVKSDLIKK